MELARWPTDCNDDLAKTLARFREVDSAIGVGLRSYSRPREAHRRTGARAGKRGATVGLANHTLLIC